ncbi:ABC transporter permease [Alcanivorax sp. JB21]|uniref:ABC transporter permease n=1 Tax=Alcanivorax limicola TaxID=2874102 RepID=UPI001CBC8CB9|nr:ABC transporter permease [Alcanivorax limicola]MBZ2187779.1 ABC transporter permease [Alcanivorax limicola]
MTTLTLPQWLQPWVRLARGEAPQAQIRLLLLQWAAPIVGILVLLAVWQLGASRINTSLGQFPGPVQVYEQAGNLLAEHRAERERSRAFMLRQEERIAARLAQQPDWEPVRRSYTGAPTFFDQIRTSLVTVLAGFLLASLIAIPLGIVMGLSRVLENALNPVVQLLKPVSPLAWLPLVTLVVAALYTTEDPAFSRSFVVSMVTVMLCSLWPTLINTAVGVKTVSDDLNNVSRVLRLKWLTHVRRIVLPSAIPMMFAGLRVSLGIAWMVLIAAEMLAQNPGLGKFVWDEFQNGSSQSLSRIMVAVLVIGAIGFALDRIMVLIQRRVDWKQD